MQNPKTFRSTSDNLSGKNSPFYVECRSTKNCRTFPPQIPKAYFAKKFPRTCEKQYWQVSREIFAHNPKTFLSYQKTITKIFLQPRGKKFRYFWLNYFCSQSVKIIRANADKYYSQLVTLDCLQNAVLTTSLKTSRSTSGGISGKVLKIFPRIHTLDT